MSQYPSIIRIMVNAVRKAGRPLQRDFYEASNIPLTRDSRALFLKTSLNRTYTLLFDELSKKKFNLYFKHSKTISYNSQRSFVISAMNGQKNFLQSLPHFSLSIALTENQDIIGSVIYNPISEELYWSYKGHGAFLNENHRLRVSEKSEPKNFVLALNQTDLFEHKQRYLDDFQNIFPHIQNLYTTGDCCLDITYVASGRFDGYLGRYINQYESMPGIALLKESGGFCYSLDSSLPETKTETDLILGNKPAYQYLKNLFYPSENNTFIQPN